MIDPNDIAKTLGGAGAGSILTFFTLSKIEERKDQWAARRRISRLCNTWVSRITVGVPPMGARVGRPPIKITTDASDPAYDSLDALVNPQWSFDLSSEIIESASWLNPDEVDATKEIMLALWGPNVLAMITNKIPYAPGRIPAQVTGPSLVLRMANVGQTLSVDELVRGEILINIMMLREINPRRARAFLGTATLCDRFLNLFDRGAKTFYARNITRI